MSLSKFYNDVKPAIPWILGGILVAGLLTGNNDDEDDVDEYEPPKKRDKKVFISFAMEDKIYRDFLRGQTINQNSPFTFQDMSLRSELPQHTWKDTCRKSIRKCDGMIVLLSGNTWKASGSRWEVRCAIEEGIPIVGMYINKYKPAGVIPELDGYKIIEWSWANLEKQINRF